MYYTALCAIAKNEDYFLHEWVAYHLGIGFEKIFLFDNASKNPIRSILKQFIELDLVHVIDWPIQDKQQLSAYVAALREFGKSCHWMGFIDLDEFIVPQNETDIRCFLDRYKKYGGVVIHRKMFGSNNHVKRPHQGVLYSYTKSLYLDRQVKTIVRPSCVQCVASPHHFKYAKGYFAVNEDCIPVSTHSSYPVVEHIQINHYYYKSLEDYKLKISRGLATRVAGKNVREKISSMHSFENQFKLVGEEDLRALECQRHPIDYVTLFDSKKSSQDFFKEINQAICESKYIDAKIIQRYLRYHSSPQDLLYAAQNFIIANENQAAFKIIQQLLLVALEKNSPQLIDIYMCLVKYYIAIGNKQKAETLNSLIEHLQLQLY